MKKGKIMKLFSVLIWFSLSLTCDPNIQQQNQNGKIVGGGCDGCEAIYKGMPKNLSRETTIADSKEPGAPLEISGTVYQADGKTPARDVILYIYQTDAKGHYSPAPGATGLARRNGHLRGWMKTDERVDEGAARGQIPQRQAGALSGKEHPGAHPPDHKRAGQE